MKTVFFALLALVVGALLNSLPVYFLWNWLMPELFGLTEITFLQSVGLSFLCGFLFKSNVINKKD